MVVVVTLWARRGFWFVVGRVRCALVVVVEGQQCGGSRVFSSLLLHKVGVTLGIAAAVVCGGRMCKVVV